ncbi:MAG TPA: hypothetical protein ENN29_12230 [Candidatus Hydrogenedentes bacterium]|nr:hypothetical protein [Candidatus Hydrogenedentota bacterium]
MNKPLHEFEALVAAARSDAPPPVQVEQQVIAALRRLSPVDERPLACMAIASAAVAAALAVIAFAQYDIIADPLFHLLYSASL